MISHRNLVANFEQLMAEYLAHHGGKFPPGAGLVSWLPFYHDMVDARDRCAHSQRTPCGSDEPDRVPEPAGALAADDGPFRHVVVRRTELRVRPHRTPRH